VAGLLPILFLPNLVDAFVLPRAALTLAGGGLVAGAGLVWGRLCLGRLRWPVAAAAVAATLAAIFSVAPALSLVGAYGRYESFPMRLAYLALFCGAAWLGERTRLISAYCWGSGLTALEALWQASTHALPRADGNLGQPDLLGAVLAVALPLSLERALSVRRRRGPVTWWPWLGLAAVLAGGLAASQSRSAWLGALVGTAALGVLRAPPAWRRRVLPLAVAAPILAAGLVLVTPLRDLNQDTGAARLGVWRDSLELIARRPLTGWGEDTTGLVFGRFQTADWEPGHDFDRAHDLFLDLAATQGLAGVAACSSLFAVWWWRAGRRALAGDATLAGIAGAVAAYGTWSLFNFDWAPATAAVWLLAGAAASGPDRRLRGRWQAKDLWRPATATAMALLGLGLAASPLVADAAYAAGEAPRAAAIDPLQARYWAAQGTVAGLERAEALGDPDPDDAVALGRAELQAGHSARAASAFRKALQVYPYDTAARQGLELSERRSASG
jgi:O-antigen ligase